MRSTGWRHSSMTTTSPSGVNGRITTASLSREVVELGVGAVRESDLLIDDVEPVARVGGTGVERLPPGRRRPVRRWCRGRSCVRIWPAGRLSVEDPQWCAPVRPRPTHVDHVVGARLRDDGVVVDRRVLDGVGQPGLEKPFGPRWRPMPLPAPTSPGGSESSVSRHHSRSKKGVAMSMCLASWVKQRLSFRSTGQRCSRAVSADVRRPTSRKAATQGLVEPGHRLFEVPGWNTTAPGSP